MTTEAKQRAAVVAEALTWVDTRYHPMQAVKAVRDETGTIVDRGGVDCATLLNEVYAAAGMIERIDISHYPPDWHMHRRTERYLETVLQHAREVWPDSVRPGDVVLFKFGLVFSHGGIVVAPGWPMMVHAFHGARRVQIDHGDGGEWGDKPRRFFSLW